MRYKYEISHAWMEWNNVCLPLNSPIIIVIRSFKRQFLFYVLVGISSLIFAKQRREIQLSFNRLNIWDNYYIIYLFSLIKNFFNFRHYHCHSMKKRRVFGTDLLNEWRLLKMVWGGFGLLINYNLLGIYIYIYSIIASLIVKEKLP